MANQKLKFATPFKGMGTHVYGERFVGRMDLVKFIQENCTSRNLSLVGLPKIGKTSIAYHSIIHLHENIVSNNLCTVFFNSGLADSPNHFFKNLVKAVRNELLRVLDESQKKKLNDLYAIVKEDDFDKYTIKSFFESGIKNMPVDVVILFDEFDKVRTIEFTGSNFGMLRDILGIGNVHGIITSKRSIYALENWYMDSSAGPSNFHQLFQGNTKHIQQFDEEDVALYWERLKPYFTEVGINIDEEYKKQAHFYAGNHPHLLDVYNALVYDTQKDSGVRPTLSAIRTTMVDAFWANIEILKSENLLDSAIQVIVGPVCKLQEDDVNRLQNYGFIQKISTTEKIKLVDACIGLTCKEETNDQEYAFLGVSKYFTLLMRNQYVNKIEFWQEWTSTFEVLRKLANKYFVDNWGESWETTSNMDPIREDMKSFYYKDVSYNIQTSPLLGYLTESLLRNLLTRCWNTFSKVFSPMDKETFMGKYEYILMLRNHHAHINSASLSEENIEKANLYLSEIRDKVTDWLSNDDASLLLTESTECFQSEIQSTTIHNNNTHTFLLNGMTYSGEIVLVGDEKKIKCANFPYPLKIEGINGECNKGQEVEFMAKCRPNDHDSNKKFWYATNVQKKKN